MASFRRMPQGGWRAEVARRGVRKSKVFSTLQAAKDWAARQEYLILNAETLRGDVTLGAAFARYAKEVSPTKRGERWEVIRLDRLQQDDIASIKMRDLRPSDFAAWRDARLRDVAPGTVNREMALISGVLTIARQEWGYLGSNPMEGVRKPSKPPPRDRRPTPAELQALAISAGDDLANATARAFHAFLFAIETAMRAGEIVGLTWDRVDLVGRVARLPMTKNGTAREVGLSREAVRLLDALPRTVDQCFDLNSGQLDALWRKLRDRAGVTGLTFHDSRHEAITRLARKLDVLDLARMVGHRDLRQLQTYYNATAAEIARRLD